MRKDWVASLLKMAEPILLDFLGDAHKMPRENIREGRNVIYLEALGRLVDGIAPWLEVDLPEGEEKELQTKFRDLTRRALQNATNPEHPLYIDFAEDYQNVVDAAFLAEGLLRAPRALWEPLSEEGKRNVILCLKKQRQRKPFYCNWLCFSAVIEMFLQFAGEPSWDPMRVDYAIRAHDSWYKGDGFYGDGPEFHFDYYNSFVIQPMLLDILLHDQSHLWDDLKETMMSRASRFAHHLETLIMPDGSYPVFGRSSCYRYGAFHALAQAMLLEDKTFDAPAVRCALEALIKKVESAPTMYDENGFLTIGVYGHQLEYANAYINTGSLYLASFVFLPLGLPPSAPFWTGEDSAWTQKKLWR